MIRRRDAPDGAEQHRNWLSLVETTGPFLSLPVLRATWPTLDPLDKKERERLRTAHATWLEDPAAGQGEWVAYVMDGLLGWGDTRHTTGLNSLAVRVAEHDTDLVPSFAVVEPGEELKPDTARLLGLVCPPGQQPTARIPGEAWAATPADRLAHLCRHHDIELGLATDGRWWALVWAPRGGATTTAVFDAVAWPEAAERDVVRAFVSLLSRHRFFGVPESERLVQLLRDSLDSQEEITEALGVQVRRAVELLVAAMGRWDVRDRQRGGQGLADVDAHEVYRGAVSVMMRVVFLLFAEERGLLPADNDLYAEAYSAGGLCDELEQRAIDGSEDDLEHTTAAWHRLLALFNAVYFGVDHERMSMPGHDGSLFHPETFKWLPLGIDDRTVLHMLRSVQYVEVGTGKSRELRTVSFATLDVEQIGYVYEGLLSWDGFRSDGVTVSLVGKPGVEHEVGLDYLEGLAAKAADLEALAAALAAEHKDSGIGSPKKLAKLLAPLDAVEREEARKRLLAVTNGDFPLAERLLPFVGVIRSDLRGLPVVILPGALFITESALRKNTGTHYTPRSLAEQVVEGALEPLVYRVGPLQTADRSTWVPKSSQEILSLKVADIAMGSAAFLVAAARYLAGHLIEAWSREGRDDAAEHLEVPADRRADEDRDPLVIEARRQIIEHCLYGVDINPMAVEMAKLSLWLVSMDPRRPFTFLDDRLVAGDSLLGLTGLDQLRFMHLDAAKGRALHEGAPVDFTVGVQTLVDEVADIRRRIGEVPLGDDPLAALERKRELLAEADEKTADARFFADLATGAALANAKRGDSGLKDGSIAAADLARRVLSGSGSAREDAAKTRAEWFATDHVPGTFDRTPLHWPLVFPEVFEQGGFDAIIGNPPFFGGTKLLPALGAAYRGYLVEHIARGIRGIRGTADLVAYFVVRGHDILNHYGQAGIVATNTLPQGDSRSVGLERLIADSVTIRKAVKSKRWPAKSAALDYCAVWTSRQHLAEGVLPVLDGVAVAGVTSSLDPQSRVVGEPLRLLANKGMCINGVKIWGSGFTVTPEQAEALISSSVRNREVLQPYLGGDDINTRPDGTASRWVINFGSWPLERAMSYTDCHDLIVRKVKPERDRVARRERVREYWWQFGEQRPELSRAIIELERVLVMTRHSSVVLPLRVSSRQVLSDALVVFPTDDDAMLAFLSSAPHLWWTIERASTLGTTIRYTPSGVLETLPLPELTGEMRRLGERLDGYRRELMLRRQAGLTATYNLVNDRTCTDDDIVELRAIHRAIDEAVCRAYGWDDLLADGLDHGFHDLGRETRYTVGPVVRQEMVDRLLEENHRRYAEEVAAGLHDKKSSRGKSVPTQSALFETDAPAGA